MSGRRALGRAAENPLLRLRGAGQGVWLDHLRRGLIDSGGLGRLIDEDGVSGLTSNPTIFARAIAVSSDYDRAIAACSDAGLRDPREVFAALAIDDVRRAAVGEDLLAQGLAAFEDDLARLLLLEAIAARLADTGVVAARPGG